MKTFFRHWNSLVFRIAMPFALLLIATMGALSLYLSGFIRQSYMEILENNLKSEVHLTADRMAVLLMNGSDSTEVETRSRLYSELLNVRVTIIAPDGKVLGESSTDPNEMENHLNRPEIQRALDKTVSTEMRYSKTLQTQMLYAAAPILNGDQIVGIARLAVSLDTIHRNENNLLGSMLIATGVATLLAILLSILIATYTISPLRELTVAAQQIASGNHDDIVISTRRDEIGQLQRAFRDMAYQLKEQIDNLRAERSKVAAVLSNMTDGVIIVDRQGKVELVNTALLNLFNTTENVLGKTLTELVRNHQMVDLWRKCLQSGEQQMTTIETTPDRLYIQEIATPMADAMPGMTLLVFQDLTRLRKLETVRQDFVSNVSHELRTPLASLKALTETLQEGALEDPPAARRFLSRMEVEIDNLTQMVQELLELSRIESGKVPLRRRAVCPCEIATPPVERMAVQAERAGLQLYMDCPADLPLVRADPDRLEHVLVNLIHNAIKYTQPGGTIRVSAYQENNWVIFYVKDSGVGIPPEALARIFERFYKADRSRAGKGTGLGLSIARHIVEAHGGKIWAESTVNQGSTFYFTLPIN